jgi:flotillin
VGDQARTDLKRLGLVLDTFKIKHISDTQGYLEAIGRRKNAEVRRDATITEANAEAEARLVAAEAKKKGSVAEAQADITIVEEENKLRVKKADLAGGANKAEAKAKVAGDIAGIEEEQKLEEKGAETNKYEADVIVPARAEKDAQELNAIGEAARIAEDGKATAGAVRVLRGQWEKEDTRELFLIQQLPDILDKVTKVVSENLSIDKVTIVDSGDGQGMPAYVKGVIGSIVAIFEQIRNATGLDIPEILRTRAQDSGQ